MDELYLMSPLEIAWGYLVGHTGSLPPPTDETVSPRQALEHVVRLSLQRPPCGVAFSGGRDSSLVLAVATHVARRDGLPEPIPITRAFPDAPEAEERDWQELVLRHLHLQDWHRVILRDELDVIGPYASEHLLRYGVVWPPTIAGDIPLVDAVRGGSVMDGEGGDEVLGVGAHRVAPLTQLLRFPRPIRLGRVGAALETIAPALVRSRLANRQYGELSFVTWLQPEAKHDLISALSRAEVDQPLSFASSVRTVPCRRTQLLGGRNRRILARSRDVEFTSPLLHPDVVHALARDGGRLGRGGRTTVLRRLIPDLLPDLVFTRTSKATFTTCYLGAHTRAFAQQWSGQGVDPELVDPEELRRIWLSDDPIAPTSGLLQAAWIASRSL